MTVTTHLAYLQETLESVVIDTPFSFYWLGVRTEALPRKMRGDIGAEGMRKYLKQLLQTRLYRNFYCPGRAVPTSSKPSQPRSAELAQFLTTLSAANAGSGSIEPGWIVHTVGHAEVVVQRNGLKIWVEPQEIRARPQRDLRAGDQLSILLPKELLNLFQGFYMALGNQGLSPGVATTVVRFYWNLQSEGACLLLSEATRFLNSAKIPFHLKVLSDPNLYNRCDAGVLYVDKHDYPRVAHAVRFIHDGLSKYLRPSTSVFTKELALGLALAESPLDLNESFGVHRCGLLAEAIIRAYERAIEPLEARMDLVAESFRDAGFSTKLPFLNPGSVDDYNFTSP
jgi:HopA1 effector protein family